MTDGQLVDKWIDGICRISLAESHLNSARRYEASARPRCGNCRHWMTDQCPREYHVNGRRWGPNCDGAPCNIFSENFSVESLRKLAEGEREKARCAMEPGA